MKAEDYRMEIKKANNSFKKMKQLADILEDLDIANAMLNQLGLHGTFSSMIKQLIKKGKQDVGKNNSKICRSKGKLTEI